MLEFDKKYFYKYSLVAGTDEAGRGPLAGPVVAASVIFKESTYIEGVNDSKKLSKKRRDLLYDEIAKKALHVGIGIVNSNQVDDLNILNATKKAMEMSILDLGVLPDIVLVDGNQINFSNYNQESIIKGDSKSFSIASASIIAKVTRDRIMDSYSKIMPEYGFESHKGYGTKKHFEAISKYKASIIHRKSFNPISKHITSFNYYIENNTVSRLIMQIAGNNLIQNKHAITDVERNCIYSNIEGSNYISYVKSNIDCNYDLDPLSLDDKVKNQLINIDFSKGTHKISINSI